MTNLSVAVADDGSASATVEFTAGTEGDAHVLYYVWSNDGVDKGDNLSAWPHVLRVGRVADDATQHDFALPPAAAVTPQYAARAILATSTAAYDYLVSSLYASEAQSCYFDTGYYPVGGKTCVTMECLLNASGTSAAQYYAFGANAKVNSSFSFCAYINGNGYWAFSSNNGGGTWKNPSTLAASKTDRVRVTLDASVSPSDFTVETPNGTTRLTSSEKHTNASTASLYLFGRNGKAEGDNDKDFAATFYSCRITHEGTLVRNYRPAVKNGVCGIYDFVNGTFAPSSGTKAFSSPGTNVTYFVAEGDRTVSASPAWKQTTSAFAIGQPYVETSSLQFPTGGSKAGAAPLTLAGKNDFGGTFTVTEGTLVADFGQGLARTDHLVLNGGAYGPQTETVFTNAFGPGGGNVSVAAGAPAAGFSAYGHPLTLTLFGEASRPLICGPAAEFSAARLILNDDWATDTLTLKNALAGEKAADGTFPALAVYTGAAEAVIEGGATQLNLDKEGAGTLVLKQSDSTMGRIRPHSGKLIIAPPDGEETCRLTLTQFSSQTGTPGAVIVSNAVVTHKGASMTYYNNTDVTFANCTVTSANDWYPANRTMINGSTAASGGLASLTLDNSTVTIDEEMYVGYYSTASQNCDCEFIITNNATLTVNKAFYGRYGNIRQYSGHVKAAYTGGGATRFGASGGWGSFHYHLYGGTLEQTKSGENATFSIAFHENSNTSGNLHVYPGGRFIARGRNGFIGRYKNNRGNLFVKGGIVQMTYSGAPLNIGYEGLGRLEVCNGGLVDINGAVIAVPTKAIINRTGFIEIQTNGTITARALYSTCTNDTAELTFDGGAFIAKAGARAPLIAGFTAAFVGIGGGTIDTAGQNLAVEQNFAARAGQTWTVGEGGDALLAAPAFMKTGEGTLRLTGTNTYACATCVSNGTLIAACEGALPETTTLRLGPSGTIDLNADSHTVTNLIGSGAVTNGTLAVTGTVWPGHGDGGTLTIAAETALRPKKLSYAVAVDGTCGLLKVNGPFDLTGVEITVANPEAAKRGLRLIEAESLTGTPVTALSGRYALSVRGNCVRLGRAATAIFLQ